MIRTKGVTSQSIYFEILDSTSTTGGRKTGLAYNSSGLTAYYVRQGGSATSITLATLAAANSAFSSGGFKEVDATNMPGIYRLDIPDAALATGADAVIVTLKGVTGMVQVSKEIELQAVNLQDSVRGGLTALPNAAAEAAGGLYTRGTGAGQINQPANGLIDVNTLRWNGTAVATPATAGIPDVNIKNVNNQAASAAAGVTFPSSIASPTNITAGTITNVTNLTNAPTSGDLTATMKTSVQTASAAALTAYDPPTNAELVSEINDVQSDIAGLNNLSQANIRTAVGLATANLDTQLAALPSAASIRGEIDSNSTQLAKLGTPAGASVSADIAAVKAQTAAIETDTGTDIPSTLGTIAGYIDTEVGAIKAKTDLIPAAPATEGNVTAVGNAVAGLNDLSAADVNAEVVDVMTTDTHSELLAAPTFPMSYETALMYQAALAVNPLTVDSDSGLQVLRNSADSADVATQTVSDDGTVFSRSKAV